MKKITNVKMLGFSLATSLILASSITVQAVTNNDYNSDGAVDSKDVVILKTGLLSKTTDIKYDVNVDGKINILDYVKLKMIIATPILNDSTDITSKFTDANFKTAVYTLIGKTSPSPIVYSDVKNKLKLDLLGKNINSLSGIEYFTALTYLYCGANQLTTLDIRKNTALTYLDCSSNQIIVLDVTKNTALTSLYCGTNKLTSLDITNNILLINLDCISNEITTLYSIKSWSTGYYNPQYTDSTHTKTLVVTLQSLTDNTDITSKFTNTNFKTEVYKLIGKTSPAPILYSDVKNVTKIDVSNKSISSLSGIEYFTALTSLACQSNQLTSLNVTRNTALITLYCSDNQLTVLDVSKNTALTSLYCYNNQLTTLCSIKDTWGTGNYRTQYTDSTHTTTTDTLVITTDNTDITNKFTDANFKIAVYTLIGKFSPAPILYSDVKNITKVDVNFKSISSLSGINYFTALTSLYCNTNLIPTLDVSRNTALTELYCYGNQLTALDVSKNTALTILDCCNNKLRTLDVSKNTALLSLNCSYNKLTTLDVSKNTALISLDCGLNQLAVLDVSKNTALTSLDCYNNQLSTLDVSKNTALIGLNCYKNQLTSLYSIKNTWATSNYNPQYTDSIHTTTTNNLVITVMSPQALQQIVPSKFVGTLDDTVNTVGTDTTFTLSGGQTINLK